MKSVLTNKYIDLHPYKKKNPGVLYCFDKFKTATGNINLVPAHAENV